MPPTAFRRVVVAAHRLPTTMRTLFLPPKGGRVFDADLHPLLLFVVTHLRHPADPRTKYGSYFAADIKPA
jgi:hypothetical protein